MECSMLSYAPSHIGCPATISVRYRVLTDEELKEVTGDWYNHLNVENIAIRKIARYISFADGGVIIRVVKNVLHSINN